MSQVTQAAPKEDEMGRIVTPVLIENLEDLMKARIGLIPPDDVRKLKIEDALVDTGATTLCLPSPLIAALGLRPVQERKSRTAGGPCVLTIHSEVQLTIQDRDTVVRVVELPEGSPVLVGQIPLEDLDLVPMPREQKLVPNPAHDGHWTIEVY